MIDWEEYDISYSILSCETDIQVFAGSQDSMFACGDLQALAAECSIFTRSSKHSKPPQQECLNQTALLQFSASHLPSSGTHVPTFLRVTCFNGQTLITTNTAIWTGIGISFGAAMVNMPLTWHEKMKKQHPREPGYRRVLKGEDGRHRQFSADWRIHRSRTFV